ncbi:MAG: hypothetical protein IKA85_05865 [Clostridia bacterium]|nr:hypothetical protein [Clostridia bacterium]
MRKRIFIKILILIFSSMLALGAFSACYNEKGENAHTHKFSSTYFYNDDYHWHKCDCKEITEKLPHNIVDGKCICGYKQYEHRCLFLNYVYNNDATCEQDGTETAICENGCSLTDTRVKLNSVVNHDYGEWQPNYDGTHIKVCYYNEEHVIYEQCYGGEATETERAVCEVCGEKYGATLGHVHDYSEQVVADRYLYSNATCESASKYYYSCVCKQRGSETFEVGKPLGHDYSIFVPYDETRHKSVCVNDNSHYVLENCVGGTATQTSLPICDLCNQGYLSDVSTGIYIGDFSILDYVIAVDDDNQILYQGALNLQSTISSIVGYNLDIVKSGYERTILLKQVSKNETAEEGFKIFVKDNDLIIECAYMNMFDIALDSFCADLQYNRGKAIYFYDGYEETIEISKVYYSEFGVVGDGVTNDFYAMKEAHDYANISGQIVCGEQGKTYLISNTVDENNVAQTITIKTDVDWCDAKIVIDDRYFTPSSPEITESVFTIANDYDRTAITNSTKTTISQFIPTKKITNTTTGFKNLLGYSALIHVYNSNRMMFNRYGYNNGGSQNEIFYIDENAKIVDSSLLFEFDDITSILVYRADNPEITVKNATIETLACLYNLGTGSNVYISRGITLSRPNAILKNLKHVVTGEIPKGTIVDGVPFNGMSNSYLKVLNTHNVLIEDCVFQGRTYYLAGTYDIAPTNSHKVLFKNCTQTNFFERKANGEESNRANFSKQWGIIGSNRCKHLDLVGCRLSRYDAHAGVTDGKIINSEVGQISVVGGGDLLIENTKIYAYRERILVLRKDYGAFWNGTITLKDCHVINAKLDDGKYRQQIISIVDADTVNHNFGFETQFPNLVIDNLKIDKAAKYVRVCNSPRAMNDPSVTKLGVKDLDGNPNLYAYYPPQYIKIYNNNDKPYQVLVPTNNGFFSKTETQNVVKNQI